MESLTMKTPVMYHFPTGFATGKLQEDTQDLLDKYNHLYDWSYNDMCNYIKLYGESKFQNATTDELYSVIYGD